MLILFGNYKPSITIIKEGYRPPKKSLFYHY